MPISVNRTTPGTIRVAINSQQRKRVNVIGVSQVLTGVSSGNGAARLVDLTDVDADDLDNGEVLVYDQANNNFEIKTIPNIEGGTF